MPADVQISVVGEDTARRKKAAGLCLTPRCDNAARAQRQFCNACRKRLWRERHPIRYLFDNLRTRAKVREKAFTLTYEQWEAFCLETDYHILKGTDADSLTVDRIRPELGYSYGNIRVRTHAFNSARQDAPPTWEDMAEAAEQGGNPF